MAIYTVHEPPLSKSDAPRAPDEFAFVRDGFYWWAFLLTPIWLLYQRLWLAFVVYAVGAGVIGLALKQLGVSNSAMLVVQLLLSVLVALEAGTLLRRKLAWWRWSEFAVVTAPKLEIAEQRFFDQWTRAVPSAEPVATPTPALRRPPPQDDAVIGLFPQPGTPR